MIVDDDHGLGHGIQNRLELGLPITRVFCFVQQPVADVAQDRSQDRKKADVDQICGISYRDLSRGRTH